MSNVSAPPSSLTAAIADSVASSTPAIVTFDPIFQSDLQHTWKGLPFPGAAFSVRLRQDVAIHKYSEKDGAEVEMLASVRLRDALRTLVVKQK